MDKEKLRTWWIVNRIFLKEWINKRAPFPWKEEDDEAAGDIFRLISAHGVQAAEVGDEEREGLVEHFDGIINSDRISVFDKPHDCPLCQKIRALLCRRRTVSREFINKYAMRILGINPVPEADLIAIVTEDINALVAELGIEVSEEK